MEFKVKCSGTIIIAVDAENEDDAICQAMEDLETNGYMIHDLINDYEVVEDDDQEGEKQ